MGDEGPHRVAQVLGAEDRLRGEGGVQVKGSLIVALLLVMLLVGCTGGQPPATKAPGASGQVTLPPSPTVPPPTVASTTKPPPVATPTPTAGPKRAQLEILSTSIHWHLQTYWEVVGELQNVGDTPVAFALLNATVYDKAGSVVSTGDGFTKRLIIPPGEKAPFNIVLKDNVSVGTDRYNVQVAWNETTIRPYSGLKVSVDREGIDPLGHYTVNGKVKNTGGEKASLIRVVGTFYDKDGEVIEVRDNFILPRSLSPGGSTLFELRVPEKELAKLVSNYSVIVDSMTSTPHMDMSPGGSALFEFRLPGPPEKGLVQVGKQI